MLGTRPSLVDLPGDILKEIVETVARLSVSNRGADNEICSLSMVNKRFYDLAIPHIFRVIRIRQLRHFSLDGLNTGLPPAALKHTIYLGLEFPMLLVMSRKHQQLFSTSYACRWIAVQLLVTLHLAKNARVVSIHIPKDIQHYLKMHADVLHKRFASVLELHYYCQIGESYLNSDIPKLFPNITTLVGLGIFMYRVDSSVDHILFPFLREVFNDHEHLKHLQFHQKWTPESLARLVQLGPRLETIVMTWPSTMCYDYYFSKNLSENVISLRRGLEQSKSVKNVTLPEYGYSFADEKAFRSILDMILADFPHIELVGADRLRHYELWRRSSNFQVMETIPKCRTTAVNHACRTVGWMRYLEPVAPHQKVRTTDDGGVRVVGLNPILEREVLG